MASSCCITGTTEKETLSKSLEWASSWATGLVKDLLIIEDGLRRIAGFGCCENQIHTNRSETTVEELESEVDSIRNLIGCLANKIQKTYSDDGESILLHLSRDFKKLNQQCKGEIPIPIDGWGFGCRKLFDNYKTYLDSTEKPLPENFILVNIAGNGDFFKGMDSYSMLSNIEQQIEKKLSEIREDVDKNPDTVPLALLFQDSEAVDALTYHTTKHILCGELGEKKGVDNISVMKRILTRWKKARIFFLKDTIDEFDSKALEKESEPKEQDIENY